MRLPIALLVACAACGRLDFDPMAGAGSDAGGGSDTGDGPGTCGAIAQMSDNFDDGVTDPKWTLGNETRMSFDEDAGSLHIMYAANTPGLVYLGYASASVFALEECAVTFRIVAISGAAPGTEVGVYLAEEATGFQLGTNVAAGQLIAYFNHGPVDFIGQQTFDPIAHAFVRMRVVAGEFTWETSPEGLVWTAFAATPSPIDLTRIYVQIIAGTNMSVVAPGDARIDDLELAAP